MIMKNVLITGAAGFLGSKITAGLQENPQVESIVATDIRELPDNMLTEKTVFYRMDIRENRIFDLLRQHKVDTVIHLAFVVNPIRNVKEMHSINIEGIRNVLEAVRSCDVKYLLVASSTSAFGAFADNPEWLTESTPVRKHPRFTYASDKYEAEQHLDTFIRENPQVKTAVIRPCIIYGPTVDNYLSRMLLGWPFLLQIGRDRPIMQFVHEDDVVDLFLLVLEREEEGVFHCVGEGVISTEEITEKAGTKIFSLPAWLAYPLVDVLYRLHLPMVEAPASMLDFIRYRWTASDSQTRERLGFQPRYSSAQVIELLLLKRRKKK